MPPAEASSTEIERALELAFYRAEGLVPPPEGRIAPADEMYGWLGTMGLDPARRRLQYARGGHEALQVIRHACAALGRPLGGQRRVLDFACGYGRLLRFLVRELPPERVWAADVLPGAVDFVGETFGVHAAPSATEPGALRLGTADFDLIWVGSLFSHLPRHRFGPWLAALHGLLSPDGLLLVSTHGAGVQSDVPKDRSGFTFLEQSESGSLDTGEYGATYVTPEVFRSIAGEHGIEHVAGNVRDLWGLQDVYAITRQAAPGLERWGNTPLVHGSIERAEVSPAGHAWIGGWAQTPADDGPLRSIELFVGDHAFTVTAIREPRPLAPEEDGGAPFLHTEWYVEGPVELPPGPLPLCAVGTTASGPRNCFDGTVLRVPHG